MDSAALVRAAQSQWRPLARFMAEYPPMNDITQLHLHVGQEIGVSPWFEVAQERIDQFASAIVDPQWIHIDP